VNYLLSDIGRPREGQSVLFTIARGNDIPEPLIVTSFV